MLQNHYYHLFKDGPLCSPEGRDCIESSSEETFGCQISCEGLYADVGRVNVVKNEQYNKIVKEYLNYKKIQIHNVRFNASADSNFFSEFSI